MTPVETLREAARLMRERAEQATPGPWSSFFGRVKVLPSTADLLLTTTTGGYGDAVHVASWHPAVALAVADWLDVEAVTADLRVGHPFPFTYPQEDSEVAALAVARAYLGETS